MTDFGAIGLVRGNQVPGTKKQNRIIAFKFQNSFWFFLSYPKGERGKGKENLDA